MKEEKKTMKKLVIAVLVLGWIMSLGLAQAQETKVGYVNLSMVFDSYEKTKNFDLELQQEAEAKRTERETLVETIKKNRDELELLSPEARAEKQQMIDEKVQELQAFDRDSRLSLRQKRDTMIREILQEIDDVIQSYGQSEGYDYIFNDRILLYKQEGNDLSNEITLRLNGN